MEHGSAGEVAGAVDVDAKFAEMMIPHHEGAIAMAEAAKERGQHDEVTGLADAIIEAQEREIGILFVGPVSFGEDVPQPKAYLRPGRRTSGRSAGASRRLRSARLVRQCV